MRKFDHNGLLIAEYQGKLFEKSTGLNCSSGIFIRRFLHSDLLKNWTPIIRQLYQWTPPKG